MKAIMAPDHERWALMKVAFHGGRGENAVARMKGSFMLGVNNSPLMNPPLSWFMKAASYMNPWPCI